MSLKQPCYSQRLHDLRSVQADFKALLRLIQEGYHFDDSDGKAALLQLEKALGHLNDEIIRLAADWKNQD